MASTAEAATESPCSCCRRLEHDPRYDNGWEFMHCFTDDDASNDKVNYRFTFHGEDAKHVQHIRFKVLGPAWRSTYTIEVIIDEKNEFLKLINHLSVVGKPQTHEFNPEIFSIQLKNYVEFSHLPKEESNPAAAMRWFFPLPVAHICRA